MSQKLIEKSEIYIKLKIITTRKIFKLNSKSSLNAVFIKTMFIHFINDDVNEVNTFKVLMNFLHNHYFSRLT